LGGGVQLPVVVYWDAGFCLLVPYINPLCIAYLFMIAKINYNFLHAEVFYHIIVVLGVYCQKI
jgi:hypothetical protein